MVPWGTGDPISSGDLNTLVFLTEKPPPLSVSIGGGSMSPGSSAHREKICNILSGIILYMRLKGMKKAVYLVIVPKVKEKT